MKKNKANLFPITTGIFLLVIFLFYSLLAAKTTNVQETQGFEICAECHDDFAQALLSQPHASNDCIACHSNPATHLEEGGGPNIFAFGVEEPSQEKSKKCLICHSGSMASYFASPHAKSSLDCTSCHTIHSEETMPALLKTSTLKNCSTCHQNVFAQFQLNERHRLQEGILGCTTCHNPHQPSSRQQLGGFKHETCLTCHTDKGGPFLHEHGASRIEGCTSCHEVHGSPNRHMLTHQSVADLCFSCHGVAPDWHSRFDSYSTNCTVCHITIHGSNLSKIFLK